MIEGLTDDELLVRAEEAPIRHVGHQRGRAMSDALHPQAHALSAFRALRAGNGRCYTATTFPKNPWQGCERFVRMCRKVGWIKDSPEPYAMLDVLDENGDIVQDYPIPDAASFRQVKAKLHLRLASDDSEGER